MHSGSHEQSGAYLRNKWLSPRRVRFWLLLLIILYALLGFFAVPWVVKNMAVDIVEEDFDRELQIESVRTNPFTLTLRMKGVVLNDIDDRQLVSADGLSVNLAWSSIFTSGWTINTIRIDNPMIHEERLTSGETRFTRLAAAMSDQPETEEETSPPALRINNVRVNDGVVRFTDNLSNADDDADTPTQVSLALQDIELSVEDFTLQEETTFPVRLGAYSPEGGSLTFDGTLQVLPSFALEGDANVDELALIQAAPYLQYFLGVQLDNGVLSMDGQIQTGTHQPFAFQGSAGISTLLVSQAPDDVTLIAWRILQTDQLELNLQDREIETDSIIIDGLAGQLVIYEDQTTNFGELGSSPPADSDTDTGRMDDEDEDLGPFSVTIKGIEVTDSGLEFADDSLPLPFSATIHMLNGEISTISSTSAQPARLELEGQVEDYGLARAEGSFHILQPTLQSFIDVTFRNIQIPEFSPYTADFAGRTIAGGIMDLDLNYTIENRQLEGENNLVVRGIELGERIDEDAISDLPLNIAISLLEDRDGVIELTLPVTGDVDDPDFDFNSLIRQALLRAVTSVIEAPFVLLANALGLDSEDLGQIEFAEGRTNLGPPQRQRIEELREALTERPDLILELAGPFSRDFDGPAIKEAKAVDVLRDHLAEADRENDDLSLMSKSNQDIVEGIFSSYYPESDLELVRARFTEETNGSSAEAEFDGLAYRNYLAEQIVAVQAVTDEDLEAIGNARAEAVRDALVNTDEDETNGETGIAADRVRILESDEIYSVEEERIVMEIGATTSEQGD